jgi:tetratricopeptide (TPR) repeat protein
VDDTRVVAVLPADEPTDESSLGSGYVLGPELVLTSAHVVPAVGSGVRVFAAGESAPRQATVVWRGEPGGRDDAALVALDDSGWRPRAGAPRSGRIVTNRAGIPCEAWGFPALAQRKGWPPETAQLYGRLNPGSGYFGDRYVMSIAEHAPGFVGGNESPWAGLSGSVMFCGQLLVGVITGDLIDWRHARLRATPMYVLARDRKFCSVLAAYGIPDLQLDPVELQTLADLEPFQVGSPASLLRARKQVVRFRGRGKLLDELGEWTAGSGFKAWLMYGHAGQGKTRLAHELATRLSRKRWTYVWLGRDAPDEVLGVLTDVAVPMLLIIDYAETRPHQVTAALRACASHNGRTAIRMLLLARTAGDWWEGLRSSSPEAEELLDSTPLAFLTDLEPSATNRRDAYSDAVLDFASVLPRISGDDHQSVADIARRIVAARPLDDPVLGSALTLHMTALADLLDASLGPRRAALAENPTEGSDANPVEDRLLMHERRYWQAAATARDLLPSTISTSNLSQALAAAFLCGAEDRESSRALLARVPGLQGHPEARLDEVGQWIVGLYPPADARYWGILQPDRLVERFVGSEIVARPDFVDCLVPHVSASQTTQLLTLYARAAHHSAFGGRLDPLLTMLCVNHRDELALCAIDVATRVEAPEPLIEGLRQVTTAPSTSREYLAEMADRLPRASYSLAEWAAELTQSLADHHRMLGRDATDEASLPNLADSLNNLSTRLSELGRWDEALVASTEAVGIRRELALTRNDAFLAELAQSLSNLSIRLAEVGRRDDALVASTEAVDISRDLAQARLHGLALALSNFSVDLGNVGNREQAHAAIMEAVTIYRELACAQPGTFRPNLAMALNNLSIQSGGLKRFDDALAASTEAVAVYRDLAGTRPDAFLPDLATSLSNLSVDLGEQDRHQEALAASAECVEIYRGLATQRPEAYLADLAGSLSNLGTDLWVNGSHERAVETSSESLRIYRELAEARADAVLPHLAMVLIDYSVQLAGLGRMDDALSASVESVNTYRILARDHIAAFSLDLADALDTLSSQLTTMGREWEAREAETESSEIRRNLAAERPDIE